MAYLGVLGAVSLCSVLHPAGVDPIPSDPQVESIVVHLNDLPSGWSEADESDPVVSYFPLIDTPCAPQGHPYLASVPAVDRLDAQVSYDFTNGVDAVRSGVMRAKTAVDWVPHIVALSQVAAECTWESEFNQPTSLTVEPMSSPQFGDWSIAIHSTSTRDYKLDFIPTESVFFHVFVDNLLLDVAYEGPSVDYDLVGALLATMTERAGGTVP